MSKIIEALKVRSTRQEDASAPSVVKEIAVEKSAHELTQEQLADIYFSATGKPRTADPPVIFRLVEQPRLASWIPWMIASLAFLVTAVSLFSTKRILVDVKILDEKSPFIRSLQQQEEGEPQGSGAPKNADAGPDDTHKISVQSMLFEGAAYLNSSKDKNGGLSLVNSSVAPFARATLSLEPPLNFSHARIVFYAKGGRGGENVAFAIKDSENVQGFYKGKLYTFPDRLTTGWQKAEILMDLDTAKDFDARNVAALRFEFGSKDTGNKPNDTVFIKDLQWVAATK